MDSLKDPVTTLGEQTQANPSFSEDRKVIVVYSSPKRVLQGELVRVTGSQRSSTPDGKHRFLKKGSLSICSRNVC